MKLLLAMVQKQADTPFQHCAMDVKIERMEAEEERRYQQARTLVRPAFDIAKWKQQDYAESARWEQQQAYQAYRQGERAEPQPEKQSLLKPPQMPGSSTLAALKMPLPSNGDIIFLVVVITVAIVIGIDASRRHGISASPTCTNTYAACFENLERLSLKNGQSLDTHQFDEMLDAIHDDLKGGWRTPFDPARMNYDTPFWDGNPRFGQKIYDDEVVCLDGKCSPRSAVNYVAQGMYSARTNQSLETAKGVAQWWNRIIYFHDATDDELYWLEYGYNAEKERAQDITQP